MVEFGMLEVFQISHEKLKPCICILYLELVEGLDSPEIRLLLGFTIGVYRCLHFSDKRLTSRIFSLSWKSFMTYLEIAYGYFPSFWHVFRKIVRVVQQCATQLLLYRHDFLYEGEWVSESDHWMNKIRSQYQVVYF